jgi:hypothetical protein
MHITLGPDAHSDRERDIQIHTNSQSHIHTRHTYINVYIQNAATQTQTQTHTSIQRNLPTPYMYYMNVPVLHDPGLVPSWPGQVSQVMAALPSGKVQGFRRCELCERIHQKGP